MKNKKGFTLIELLAVIVVLAIIALIATPIVMNTIKNAKKGAAERTADNYIKQVETAVAESRIDGTKIPNGTYNIQPDGNLCPTSGCGENDKDKITIDMSGNKPSGGTVTISNGEVLQDGIKLVVGDYNVKYKDDKLTASEPYKGVLCKANTTKATALVWAGKANPGQESSYTSEEVGVLSSEAASKYDVGVTYTCELGDGEENIFYVLETNGDNVSLIAGMNLGATVAWSIDGKNHKDEDESVQAVTAKATLKERTSTWTKLDEDQIMLPTGQQIASAGGNIEWIESNYSGTEPKLPTWLNSYTKFTSGTYGYWTSTPYTSETNRAWHVYYSGSLFPFNFSVETETYCGVRPVITISKSNLS